MNGRADMGELIYIVDDDVDILMVLVEALSDEGYEAIGFTSPTLALDAIEHRLPDLLITDFMLPTMDGDELVTRVREGAGANDAAAAQALPILVVSAVATPKTVAHMPIQAFISKPFDLDDLLAQVAYLVCVSARTPAMVPAHPQR
jgi:CheY-like chemotaxis protein